MEQNKIMEVYDLFVENQIPEDEVANEVLRFRALDQILLASPHVQHWGITIEKLYELLKNSTEEVFGPVNYSIETFSQIYRQSFAVDAIDFLVETGYSDEIKQGRQWVSIIESMIEPYKNGLKGRILFVGAEEYVGQVDYILQTLAHCDVCFYTNSSDCYDVFQKLYPLATVYQTLPDEGTFDRVLFISDEYSFTSHQLVKELACSLALLSEEGEGRFLLPTTFMYLSDSLVQHSVHFMLEQNRLRTIVEWLGLGVYEFVMGSEKDSPSKVQLCLRQFELLDETEEKNQFEEIDEAWVDTALIPLPHTVLAEMDCFSLFSYALILRGIEHQNWLGQRALSEESTLVTDLNQAGWKSLQLHGLHVLYITKGAQGFKLTSLVSTNEEIVGGICFASLEAGQAWLAYWHSSFGQTCMEALNTYTSTVKGLYQLMSASRRIVEEAPVEVERAEMLQASLRKYQQQIDRAQKEWNASIEEIAKTVIPHFKI